MATNACPKCGAQNPPGFRFCTNCGTPLPAAAGPPAYPPPGAVPYPQPYYPTPYPMMYPSPQAYQAALAAQEAKKKVDWTQTGLLLIFIGIILGWLPYVGFVGIILIIVGAFFVIGGRNPFGRQHSRYVMISLWVVIAALVAAVALFIALFSIVLSQFANPSRPPDPSTLFASLGGVFDAYLLGTAVATSVVAFATLLFTYSLQQRVGQYLLWAGFAAGVAVQVLRYFVLRDLFRNLFSSASTGTFDPFTFTSFSNQALALTFLAGIPAVLNGAAYYLAWARVKRGEIPVPAAGQPPPTYPTYSASPPVGQG